MQLTQIKQIKGTLVLKTGLHIGGGDTEMHIGGLDNQVVKNPLDGMPYIPGWYWLPRANRFPSNKSRPKKSTRPPGICYDFSVAHLTGTQMRRLKR